MDLPSDTKIWSPQRSGTLKGVFHLLDGLNWTVRTEDGTVWLLEADAEDQLEALDPSEGQVVHVLCERDGGRPPEYRVTLPTTGEEDVMDTQVAFNQQTIDMDPMPEDTDPEDEDEDEDED